MQKDVSTDTVLSTRYIFFHVASKLPWGQAMVVGIWAKLQVMIEVYIHTCYIHCEKDILQGEYATNHTKHCRVNGDISIQSQIQQELFHFFIPCK